MWWRGASAAARYAVAVGSVAAALTVQLLLWPHMRPAPALLFFAATLVSSWFGGWKPGALTALLSLPLINYFFVAPERSWKSLYADGALVTLLLFLGVMALMIACIEELHRERARAERAVAERQRVEEERERFIHVLAHDLRTPLSAVHLTTAALLRRGDLPEAATRALERAERSVERMARLIEQLLDFARARGPSGFSLERHPVDLAELCREAASEIAMQTQNGPVEVQVEAGEAVVGPWDRDRLAQVVQNLLANAVQYRIDGTPVVVRVARDHDAVVLEVKNQAPPIPLETMPRLFEPFRRSSKGTKSGVGLGLFITKGIVDAHGGKIQVESSERGTTFRVHLPR